MERMEADQSSFAPALQDLGLKLEALKAPVEIVIVDRAEKIPTENWSLARLSRRSVWKSVIRVPRHCHEKRPISTSAR